MRNCSQLPVLEYQSVIFNFYFLNSAAVQSHQIEVEFERKEPLISAGVEPLMLVFWCIVARINEWKYQLSGKGVRNGGGPKVLRQ